MTVNRLAGKLAKKMLPRNIQTVLRFWYWKIIKENQNRPRKTLQFEVHLTDHCNLNCSGCSHFSPIAEEHFIDCDSFERDCKRIYELTKGHVEKIHLMGGEPLLHPDCINIINIAGKYFNSNQIEIVTNGILLPNQNHEFWECCKTNKVTIIITNYPIKRDDDTIRKITQEYNIDLEYWPVDNSIKTFDRIPIDLNGNQDREESFRDCRTKNLCIQLKDGKLYTCHTAAYMEYFNTCFEQTITASEHDYIDIYKVKNVREILVFLSKSIPFCKYCNTKNRTDGIKWGISMKKIEEWT